ncbi:PREDICTED: uncharacterized protein LOC108557092 [Nicrophorus vespilloides]|uniref:Uncharacterized protein LOC108557092 n=1 Tax=Nicrophorus vespilloides TaxID=110193 RepID=A0ABM1M313_NICVS|nr:PREDICTED: uncharacterized protein LOC108557092 [Nicrophorus vespilloides]
METRQGLPTPVVSIGGGSSDGNNSNTVAVVVSMWCWLLVGNVTMPDPYMGRCPTMVNRRVSFLRILGCGRSTPPPLTHVDRTTISQYTIAFEPINNSTPTNQPALISSNRSAGAQSAFSPGWTSPPDRSASAAGDHL